MYSPICEQHCPLENTQFCFECNIFMCVSCQNSHLLENNLHRIVSISDILSQIISCYKNTEKINITQKSALIGKIQEKIKQIDLFENEFITHISQICTKIIQKETQKYRDFYNDSLQKLLKNESQNSQIFYEQTISEYKTKQYFDLISKYKNLPEIKKNLSQKDAEICEIKEKIENSHFKSYNSLKENVDQILQKLTEILKISIDNKKCTKCTKNTDEIIQNCQNCSSKLEICKECSIICSKCKNFNSCQNCLFYCNSCNNHHCFNCTPSRYQCHNCRKILCGVNGIKCCSKIAICMDSQICSCSQISQLSSYNTSHWNPEILLTPNSCYPYAFSGGKLGWVCWNFGIPKKISRLIYVAQSGNTVAIECSKDGKNFIEINRFIDDKQFIDLKLRTDESYTFWRVRMLNSTGSSPYHHAIWYS